MSPIQDDPRDVLTFLNSLGFVGITAPQLKLFMKDLKLYRKTKQREEKEWKEKMKEKIRNKPNLCFNDVLQQCSSTEIRTKHTSSSDSYTSRESSSIQIHLQYSKRRKDKENQVQRNSNADTLSSSEYSSTDSKNCYIEKLVSEKGGKNGVAVQTSGSHGCTILEELSRLTVKKQDKRKNLDDEKEIDEVEKEQKRISNRPENVQRSSRSRTRSAGTDSARTRTTQRSSSRSKSFIRPWNLVSEGQPLGNKKSDPVTLYQKYQQEWNKFTIPGEDNRTKLRWEIREKMLGTDPHPKPILKKSASSATLRKRKL